MMKARYVNLALTAALFASCASSPVRDGYSDLESLVEDAAWEVIDILWGHFEDLETAPDGTIATYHFTDAAGISPLSDEPVDGLTEGLANAIVEEDIHVKVLSAHTGHPQRSSWTPGCSSDTITPEYGLRPSHCGAFTHERAYAITCSFSGSLCSS